MSRAPSTHSSTRASPQPACACFSQHDDHSPLPGAGGSSIAAAPPALVVDAALPPMADAVRVLSKRAAQREKPGAEREAPPAKPETAYYSAREVDVRAVPLGEIVPINPDFSGRESGVVVLRVLINAGGSVDNVLVVSAEPANNFGPQLLLPFKRARFLPARKSGIAVNSEMLIELRYGGIEEGKP